MIRALVVVAALTTIAHAGGPPLPCNAAKPRGTPIFEARYLTGDGKRGMVTRLYASGTFTRTPTKADGKPRSTDVSCIAKPELDEVMKALRAATWKATKQDTSCTVISDESTTIYAFGKKRFVLHVCDRLGPDEASMNAIALVGTKVGILATDRIGDFDDGFDNPLAR